MGSAPNDRALAFDLAGAARRYLRRAERDQIYVAIGVGDTFEAIDSLLTAIAHHHVPVDGYLVGALSTWLNRYRGQDVEPRLRDVLSHVIVNDGAAVTPVNQ